MSDVEMPDRRVVYVFTEKMGRTGCITTTGWPYTVGEKVSAILNKTWGDGSRPDGWRTYRLAYGVKKIRSRPTQLKWVDLSPPYDPTMEELFDGISLRPEEDYYLLISILDVNNRYDERFGNSVRSAVCWLQGLYMYLPERHRGTAHPPVSADSRLGSLLVQLRDASATRIKDCLN